MDDNFDDLLADIDIPEQEATLPKIPKIEDPSTSTNNANSTTETSSKISGSKSQCVLVNPKQKGNPLLRSIRNVPWELDDIIPDYIMGPTTCAMFLSIRYHNMNPDYIHERLKLLGKSFTLRVLLVQVDVPDPHIALKNLTRICLLADLTLMLAWSADEAGKIIETYKIYENKPPDKIMEKVENDPHQKITSALTSIKPVNKTDALTLLSTFGSLGNIIKLSETKLSNCPGFGTRKASKLYSVLHEPFLKKGVANSSKKESTTAADDIDMDQIDDILKQHEDEKAA